MSRLPPPDAPTKLELHYSALRVVALTAGVILVLGWTAYWVVAGIVSRHFLAVIVGVGAFVISVLVVSSTLGALVHAWRHRGPVVVIDLEGIRDMRKRVEFIPWSDVKEVRLGAGETASILCFNFRQPDKKRADGPPSRIVQVFWRTYRFIGDWNVSLRLLSCRRFDVLKRTVALQRQAMLRRVAELNRDNKNGWSGTL